MTSVSTYEDEKEMKRHNSAIQKLAQDLGVDEAEIKALYERNLGELMKHARIKEYLTVFASRKVRESLKSR